MERSFACPLCGTDLVAGDGIACPECGDEFELPKGNDAFDELSAILQTRGSSFPTFAQDNEIARGGMGAVI